MRVLSRLPLFAGLAALLSGCATFGTNVEGSFQCRAPEGSCAPSHIIDARAAGEIRQAEAPANTLRPPRMVDPGDQARTAERTLKIVFPARVDETGTLHDEAVYLPLTYQRNRAVFTKDLKNVTFNPSQFEIPLEKMAF